MTRLPFKSFIVLCIIGFLIISCNKDSTHNPLPPVESDMERIDEMVYSFMSKNAVPGATLAVAKDGKLVYVRAYGFADRETAERMTENTRSRISSISKTVTAIAIMKLHEEGKLSLDDKIFGPDGILGDDFGTVRPYRPYITDLTIKHCLSHHVGGWANNSSDPTTMRNEMSASQLLTYIIDNIPLTSHPGGSYAYSNVGYMILGRVIEKISQKPYEQFVQEEILQPAGIQSMEIGGNTLAERRPNESRYHQNAAYTSNFSRRDANGGWIATAADLVRLFVRVDGSPTVPDLLSPSSIQTMTTPPFAYQGYGLGIMLKGGNWYHGGSFPGSRSHFVRTPSGMVAAIMVNNNASQLEDLLNNIVHASVTWPTEDQF